MPDIIKDLNLNKNELKNAVVETAPSLSSAPSSPRKNQIYFNSTNNILYRYNGTTWVADNKVGQIYFNTSDNNLYRYNGSNWVTYQAPLSTVNASTISIDSTPTASSTNLVTSGGVASAITNAINALDGGTIGTPGAGKTLTALSQTNGNVSATFGDISITKSQISDFPTIPGGSSTSPKMDGTATVGTETAWAHGDHIHPSDTNKQNKITASGILKGDGTGTVTAATAGTDYQAPLPSQVGNSGKFLTTNGSALSWANTSLPPYYAEFSIEAGIDGEIVSCDTTISSLIQMVYERPVYGIIDNSVIFQVISITADSIIFQIQSDNAIITLSGTINQSTDVWEISYLYLQQQLNTNGILKGNGSGTITAAVAGTDYQAPLTAGTDYVTPSQIPTITVSPTLTSGEEVGTITIDGTTTTLYAPEDTDTKVNQTKVTYSSYTYWRAIPFGTYNASTPIAALSATNTTDREYTVDNLRFWPQNGWIRTHAFNPAPNAAGTTNSYNQMTSDSVNNIYFRVNATGTGDAAGDTVMTLYSNGTDMQVRPGGQYNDKVDLGKNTTRWKKLYLTDNVHLGTGDIRFEDNIYGYYKSADGKFYENYSNSTYSDVITGQTGKRYIDRNSTNTYYWNGSSYTVISNDDFYGTKISNPNHTQLNLDGYNTLGTHSDVTVRGVATPTNNNDAVNKAYVDSAISGISFPTNCEVTVTHIVGTWNVDTTYATMVAAHNAGGVVYFTYGSYTAIASFHTSNIVTANIMYMDNEGIYQIEITVNSSDEVNCTETNYTFPTIYNGETS